MTANVKRSLEAAGAILATVLFLLIAGRNIGIDPFDESIYLQGARWAGVNQFLANQAWGPLYSLWYRFLAHFVPDPEPRYFVSWGCMVIFLSLLPLVARIPGAWIYTCLLLTLPALLPVPYVSLFAGCALLLGMCFMIRTQNRPRQLSRIFGLACLTCFLAAFSRPEFQDGVAFAAVATVLALLVERHSRQHKLRALGLALGVALLAVLIHLAASHSGGNRSGFAFLDSVNLRASDKHMLGGENPWLSTYAQREFGLDTDLRAPHATHPIGAYFRANPKLFIAHIIDNIVDPRTAGFLILLLGLVAWTWLRRENKPLRQTSVFLLTLCVAPLGGILLIYPREHYAMSIFPSILLFLVAVLKPQRWLSLSPVPILAFAAVLAFFIYLSHWRLQISPFPDQRAHLPRLACAQAVDPLVAKRHILVFDARHGVAQYMHEFRYPEYPEEIGSWAAFEAWTKKNDPGWISFNTDAQNILHTTPEQIDHFVVDEMGYVARPCPAGTDIRMYYNPRP